MEKEIKLPNIFLYQYSKGLIDSLLESGDITHEERNNILKSIARKYEVEKEVND